MPISIRSRCLFPFLVAIFILLHAGCSTVPAGFSDKDKQDAFANIAFYRNYSEIQVAIAKEKLNDKALMEIREKYSLAAAYGNAVIDKIQLNLTAGALSQADLGPDVQKIADAVNSLHNSLQAARPPPSGPTAALPGIPELLMVNVEKLTNSFVTIWKAAKDQENKVIEDIKARLDKLRWSKWEDIRAT